MYIGVSNPFSYVSISLSHIFFQHNNSLKWDSTLTLHPTPWVLQTFPCSLVLINQTLSFPMVWSLFVKNCKYSEYDNITYFVFVIFSDGKIPLLTWANNFFFPSSCQSGNLHSYSFLWAIGASPCSTANLGGDYMQRHHRGKGTDKQFDMLFVFLSLLEICLINSSQ